MMLSNLILLIYCVLSTHAQKEKPNDLVTVESLSLRNEGDGRKILQGEIGSNLVVNYTLQETKYLFKLDYNSTVEILWAKDIIMLGKSNYTRLEAKEITGIAHYVLQVTLRDLRMCDNGTVFKYVATNHVLQFASGEYEVFVLPESNNSSKVECKFGLRSLLTFNSILYLCYNSYFLPHNNTHLNITKGGEGQFDFGRRKNYPDRDT